MNTRELLAQALDVLENHEGNYKLGVVQGKAHAEVITAIREHLARPEPEPVGWLAKDGCLLSEADRETNATTLLREGWEPLFTKDQL